MCQALGALLQSGGARQWLVGGEIIFKVLQVLLIVILEEIFIVISSSVLC
jgi:hypothetical protein